jgi:hypothetical protein
MHIKFTQAARKHRIGKARAIFVIENNSFFVIRSDEGNKIQYVWVAVDDREIELEIIGVVVEDYVLITHVMPTSLRRRKKEWHSQ